MFAEVDGATSFFFFYVIALRFLFFGHTDVLAKIVLYYSERPLRISMNFITNSSISTNHRVCSSTVITLIAEPFLYENEI